jgi:ABC-type polysaccharide/polyol phosphate transport system ATPase subunit
LPSASTELAVRVQDLSLTYRTSSETTRLLGTSFLKLRQSSRKRKYVEALRGVSFEVPKGSVLGIVGRNGSGKSTLLRILSGVLHPTGGSAELYGRVTPLLTLGVGFNPMLSGRDNILLGGLCGGMSVEETRSKVDDIIEFSGLGDAIDRPIRTYSNGMYSRLGFSVAALLEPEIILIDEVLAAGDAAFMLKSAGKIKQLAAADTTVIIVSHVMGVLRSLADHCIWMQEGEILRSGGAEEVINDYMEAEGLDRTALDRLDDTIAEWARNF